MATWPLQWLICDNGNIPQIEKLKIITTYFAVTITNMEIIQTPDITWFFSHENRDTVKPMLAIFDSIRSYPTHTGGQLIKTTCHNENWIVH